MPILINNFQKGQSSSPYLLDGAFSKSQNLDVFSQKGIARINYLPTASSGAATDLMRHFSPASNSATTFYSTDDSDNVYVIDPTASPFTISQKEGIAADSVLHWKGYLLGFTVSNLKYFDSPNWVNFADTDTFSSAVGHPFLNSINDGKLYFCSGRDIDVLIEDTNFNPSDNATYTFTKGVFTLPEGYMARGISELGIYLVIAAISVTSGFTERKNPITTYFFWDRSASTADRILELPAKRMTNMLGIGGTIFIAGGEMGKIYTLTESGLEFYTQLPFDYDNGKVISIGPKLDIISMAWWQDMLLVGASNNSTTGLYPIGIYAVKNKRISHLCLPSEGLDGSTKRIWIGAIYSYDEQTFFFAWKNITDNTQGIDKVITSGNRQTSYSSYLESIFTPVATRGSKKSFDKVEVQLARPLQTGEGVRIKWRKNINDSWTTLGTQTFATNGAVSSLEFPGIHNLENIQIRYEATTGASSKNTPLLLEIRLLP